MQASAFPGFIIVHRLLDMRREFVGLTRHDQEELEALPLRQGTRTTEDVLATSR